MDGREQTIERLALRFGRVAVYLTSPRPGCHTVVEPRGQAFHINEDGQVLHEDISFAPDWRQ